MSVRPKDVYKAFGVTRWDRLLLWWHSPGYKMARAQVRRDRDRIVREIRAVQDAALDTQETEG